jgi:hypothetical protein
MVSKISSFEYKTNYLSGKKDNNSRSNETHILPNNLETRFHQGSQKVLSAFIDYPVKGLMGDKNSNFYEFLTMGIVPYVLGSAMFMLVFNLTKHLDAHGKKSAANVGRKMALGVILYGVLKSFSKNFVSKPVKKFTGVDTEMPYQNKVYNLPKSADENANIDVQWQQRKVFDSKEFYRKDLLEREYFDNVAKKLGLGEKLNDSITETSPIIQNIVATSNLAKSLSSYCWAGVGVGLATQDAWLDFFTTLENKKHFKSSADMGLLQKIYGKTKVFCENFIDGSLSFIKSFVKSCSQMWKGKPASEGFSQKAGKYFILLSTAVTTILTANSILRAKNMAKEVNKNTIDKSKEVVEI